MKGQLLFGVLLLGAHFGFSIPNEHQRIIDGNLAVAKQFPYQVFFDIFDPSNFSKPFAWQPSCGGALISKRIILTAAHCFQSPKIYAIQIYFGAVDMLNTSEIGQHQLVVKFANVVVHQEYDTKHLYNDIALIKLPIDVAFDEYIKPVKLPQPGIIYSSEAIASGFGVVKANGTTIFDSQLRYNHFEILSDAECKIRLPKHFIVSSRICLAPSQNPTCFGDSGGPLTVRHKGDIVLLGLTSYGITSNCTDEFPDIYTRVASYLNWIRKNAGAHNLEE
ncbi:hypothetical protein KR038_002572 [Drosophila bunnanda]|nr:hypothetical protein KR038_002572 [Drosophila bunnanda]